MKVKYLVMVTKRVSVDVNSDLSDCGVPATVCTSCVTLGWSLNLSEPELSHPEKWGDSFLPSGGKEILTRERFIVCQYSKKSEP